ncbi:MAG: hypothetical protein NDI81_08645 [Desulfobacula sp.]|nr:hypothetical protein [Desulfobacula sp.]
MPKKIQDRGGQVFFATDATKAVVYCLKAAKENRINMVVKGKSMVIEEIGLNEAPGQKTR